MKRKALIMMLVLCMVLAVMPYTVSADDVSASGMCGENVSWTLENGVLTISGSGEMDMYSRGDDGGTMILPPWYSVSNYITDVVIEEGVTNVGSVSFWSCYKLKRATIADTVTHIGKEAFFVSGLSEIDLGSGVTEIGTRAFEMCPLTSIVLPDSVTTIGERAFAYAHLEEITLGSGVSALTTEDFQYNEALKAIWVDADNPYFSSDSSGVLFDKNKTTLLALPGAFTGAYTVPDTVTYIEEFAFANRTSLTAVTVPEQVSAIGMWAFAECTALETVNLPENITAIEKYTFYACETLKRIDLPSGLTGIGYAAFSGSAVEEIDLPVGVTVIEQGAFANCDSLKSITLPETVTSVERGAFRECDSLTKVVISSGGTELGSYSFEDCTQLSEIRFLGDMPEIGVAAFTNVTAVVYYPLDRDSWTGNIGGSYGGELTWKPYLDGVELPEINDPVASSGRCGDSAYWILTTDGTLTIFGSGEMYDYDHPRNEPRWKWSVAVTALVIEEGITTIGAEAFYACEQLTAVSLPDTVTVIGNQAFEGCASLETIELPRNLTKLGFWAFANTALREISLPDGLTTIDYCAFRNCDNLQSIVIPASVTEIGREAFGRCGQLSEIRFVGDKPEFGTNILSDVTATLYYPAANSTWTPYVGSSCGGTITWVPYGETDRPPVFYDRPTVNMFRMYDPNSGEHFYTGSTEERDNLVAEGWKYEGVGFTFPMTTGKPVYRLYDPVYGEHLYTMDEDEKARLMAAGWNYEGVAFNSGFEDEVPQYRLHNPNETRGAYHFTASVEEMEYLISLGWEYQGIGWYSCWK